MKLFIRHAMGAGGHFISALAAGFLQSTEHALTKEGSAHNHQYLYLSHNYDQIAYATVQDRDPVKMEEYIKYTEDEYNNQYPNISEGVRWFRNNLHYHKDGAIGGWHFVRTHAQNLNSLVAAAGITDSKILNITLTEKNIKQLSFNYVVKTIIPNPNWMTERSCDIIEPLHYNFQDRYAYVDHSYLVKKAQEKDLEILTWVIEKAWSRYWTNYRLYTPPAEFNAFNISWDEIIDCSLSDRINHFAEYLGVTPSELQLTNANKFIRQYSLAQMPIPF
jgi:hypothetical protein